MMIKKGLNTLKKPALLLSASLGLWLGMACQDDVTTGQALPVGDEIQFSIASDSIGENQSVGAVSRSASRVSTHFLTVIGEDSLYLEVKEEENDRPFYTMAEDTVESRGASYDNTNKPLTSFFLTAFLEDGAEFMKDEEVTKTENGWEYSPIKYWPQNQAVHFFGYARSMEEGTLDNHQYSMDEKNGSYTHTFDYTMPSGDATNQPDLIVAITPNQTKQSINGSVLMSFKHALSAVVFKVGEIPDGVTINHVSFDEIYSSGTGSINQTGAIVWSNTKNKTSFTQVFDIDVTSNNVLSSTADEACFMMIPQLFGDDAAITIDFSIGEETEKRNYTLTKYLKELVGEDYAGWKPDMKYTYIISLPDEIKVEVDDKVSGNKKYDLSIKNTGISRIYVRAAIIGHWVIEDDDTKHIVEDWKETDGTFDWEINGGEPSKEATTGWRKGEDGFYYYLEPVERTSETPALFESYTLNSNKAPTDGAELELTIAVQAVLAKDVKHVWPEDVLGAKSNWDLNINK